jgi:hypothetical protein
MMRPVTDRPEVTEALVTVSDELGISRSLPARRKIPERPRPGSRIEAVS